MPRPVFRGLRPQPSQQGPDGPVDRLAVPRPVFRGLRLLFHHGLDPVGEASLLAVPRPVFRGLRPIWGGQRASPEAQACSAETRFQGIATQGDRGIFRYPFFCDPCSAETRFQGIATCRNGSTLGAVGLIPTCSAETRFQGIATCPSNEASHTESYPPCSAETRFQGIATGPGDPGQCRCHRRFLQCRDPFSGDCDTFATWRSPRSRAYFLQCRDPFSGDCDSKTDLTSDPLRSPSQLAVPRPVFRGLRQSGFCDPIVCSDPGLQCRDPFSGDCDRDGDSSSPSRSKGEGGHLQCRDPFSGDCDRMEIWNGSS